MLRAAARALVGIGALAVAGAWVMLVLPLQAGGVSGTAFRPHYRSYQWFATHGRAVPGQTAPSALAAKDQVDTRRHDAAILATTGALVLGVGLVVRRRTARAPSPAAAYPVDSTSHRRQETGRPGRTLLPWRR